MRTSTQIMYSPESMWEKLSAATYTNKEPYVSLRVGDTVSIYFDKPEHLRELAQLAAKHAMELEKAIEMRKDISGP